MPRNRARRGPMEAMPLLGSMAEEQNTKVRLAYALLPLGGIAGAVVTTLAHYGKPNPAAPVLFVGGILAAVGVWVFRQPRRETLKYLSVAVLVGVLTLSLATVQEKARPPAKQTTAAKMSGSIDGLGTNVSTCLVNLFSGRWGTQRCSAEVPKPAKKAKAKALDR
jgi:uncharacterized membrane protein YfcA